MLMYANGFDYFMYLLEFGLTKSIFVNINLKLLNIYVKKYQNIKREKKTQRKSKNSITSFELKKDIQH